MSDDHQLLHFVFGGELVDGRQLVAGIEKLLADPRAAYLHVHFVATGCYAACVKRHESPGSRAVPFRNG